MPDPETFLVFAASALALVPIPGPGLRTLLSHEGLDSGGVYLALAAVAALAGGRRRPA